ncbi:hypothetical protein D9M71_493940 [compost metagenome]
MQLADAGFADAQHLADFLEVQLFVVIQGQDQSFAFRQVGDRIGQCRLEPFILQIARRFQRGIGAVLMQPLMLAVLQQVVETEQATAQGIVQNAVVIIEA